MRSDTGTHDPFEKRPVKLFSLHPYPFGDLNRLYGVKGKEGDQVFNTNDSMRSSEGSESDVHERLSTLRDHLLRYCEFLSGSRHEAEDVVQTTLIKALPVLKGAEKHPNVSALLRRIAKNTWLDHVRKQRKFRPYNPMELYAVCGSMPPEDRLEVEAALQVIQQLTAQQRAVFLLCEVFEYTDREAGELLGMNRGAVKATLHRAKVRLISMKELLPERDDGVQNEILQAYVAAFYAADITTLMHLCQGGILDPVHATSKVLTFAQRQTNARRTNGGTQMSILAAA
ncbi:hypothetical protein JIR001_14240 [Polycladomyces abyssicola]|uniref:Uncharacterized protein n=1 Tax=Polycladomyces abyssicola TaxID=1125966 RepID=A0A8D5UDX9_9BACL|nr:RNA polymerase sigma factor [Polycladomyces abyssicola]BCU81641.1 hypothetical protein JIR001_14240 [Polycladomyces abyssicola]